MSIGAALSCVINNEKTGPPMRSVQRNNRLAVRFIAPLGAMLAIVAMPAMASAAGPAGLVDGFGKTVARMIDGDRALAPFASVVFCMQQSAQCADTGGPDVVQLGESQRAQLVDINNTYNHSIRPQNDASGTDVWSVDVTAGDCEDYALTKQSTFLRSDGHLGHCASR